MEPTSFLDLCWYQLLQPYEKLSLVLHSSQKNSIKLNIRNEQIITTLCDSALLSTSIKTLLAFQYVLIALFSQLSQSTVTEKHPYMKIL